MYVFSKGCPFDPLPFPPCVFHTLLTKNFVHRTLLKGESTGTEVRSSSSTRKDITIWAKTGEVT